MIQSTQALVAGKDCELISYTDALISVIITVASTMEMECDNGNNIKSKYLTCSTSLFVLYLLIAVFGSSTY